MKFSPKEIIVVIGYGRVGQANALVLSGAGYEVYYYDVTEPNLHYADKYRELYDSIVPLSSVLEKDSPDTWYLVCVGDRVTPEGEQDISSIQKAIDLLKDVQGGIILRSTVLPGYLASLNFHYYIPEFLHEKMAVEECMNPHYFIVGKKDGADRIPDFFNIWQKHAIKVFYGTSEEASYIKYLSNIWNALRISFVNEFGTAMALPTDQENLANIKKIINFFFEEKSYLRYGKSFGGHCLPKDTRVFYAWCKKRGNDMPLLQGVCKANDAQQIIEKQYPILPEWFSEWVRPQISGWVALHALKSSIQRKLKKIFKNPLTGK